MKNECMDKKFFDRGFQPEIWIEKLCRNAITQFVQFLLKNSSGKIHGSKQKRNSETVVTLFSEFETHFSHILFTSFTQNNEVNFFLFAEKTSK